MVKIEKLKQQIEALQKTVEDLTSIIKRQGEAFKMAAQSINLFVLNQRFDDIEEEEETYGDPSQWDRLDGTKSN